MQIWRNRTEIGNETLTHTHTHARAHTNTHTHAQTDVWMVGRKFKGYYPSLRFRCAVKDYATCYQNPSIDIEQNAILYYSKPFDEFCPSAIRYSTSYRYQPSPSQHTTCISTNETPFRISRGTIGPSTKRHLMAVSPLSAL